MEAHEGERPERGSRRRRRPVLATLAALAALAAIAAIAVGALELTGSERQGPSPADAFYEPPTPLPPGAAGEIVRSAAIAGPPPGARAWRILYRTRDHDDRAAALSALVFVPTRAAPSNGRNVVALVHGTVGVAQRCGLSRARARFAALDGLVRFLRAGWVVVAPDLEGLGTAGTHPYLVGDAAARATLDAVRAAGRFAPAAASERFVAWGVGQGGHAALFTGQVAGTYAPELELAGVAAAAPLASLRRLVDVNRNTTPGRILAADLLATWSGVYPELRLEQVLTPAGRRTLAALAARCAPLDGGSLRAALDGLDTTLDYRARRPWNSAPWSQLLARNAPGQRTIPAPVIVTQGGADPFVRPALTARFVRYLCSLGTTVQYRPSRGVAHADVGAKTAPYVSHWIARRFAGDPARSTC